MRYWYQKPHPSLSKCTRTVLIMEGFSKPGSDNLPIVTNGASALLCRMEKDETGNETISALTLFGKSIPAGSISVNANTTIIIYFFKPFVLASLFNIPAVKLMQSPVELSHWNAHKTNALKTQLVYSGSTKRKREVLDNLLILQLQQQQTACEIIQYATDEMMIHTAKHVLSDLLRKLHVNERTFQRLFKKYVGITAGQYRRICQFQLSFTQLRSKKFGKLTDIAYDNGFADQSHFIRSFKDFTQITPHDYLKYGLKNKVE